MEVARQHVIRLERLQRLENERRYLRDASRHCDETLEGVEAQLHRIAEAKRGWVVRHQRMEAQRRDAMAVEMAERANVETDWRRAVDQAHANLKQDIAGVRPMPPSHRRNQQPAITQ